MVVEGLMLEDDREKQVRHFVTRSLSREVASGRMTKRRALELYSRYRKIPPLSQKALEAVGEALVPYLPPLWETEEQLQQFVASLKE